MTDAFADTLFSFPVALTLKVGAACLGLFLVIGLPLAWWGSGKKSFARRVVSFLTTLPLVFPPVALGFI
ncbi:MAG: molybdenum ABC transporter permease, partial [Deltaproteobacteria bacterium]|nr:molybdenum ABC transporter permease [Deltaproteobacteria bacterium]